MALKLKSRIGFVTSLGLIIAMGLSASHARAASSSTVLKATPGDYLIEMVPNAVAAEDFSMMMPAQSKIHSLGLRGWYHIKLPAQAAKAVSIEALSHVPGVLYVQPNYKIHLLANPSLDKLRAEVKQQLLKWRERSQNAGSASNPCPFPIPGLCNPNGGGGNVPIPGGGGNAPTVKPPIPAPVTPTIAGPDPLFKKQWGMITIGVKDRLIQNAKPVVVAVLDTGIDYTHEDLVPNLWRNPGEMGTDAFGRNKSTNQIDDDNNGYVDDVIGWDFVDNDNKPYDKTTPAIDLLLNKGGNPGHGTHCSGNVGARGDNGKGISGVDPTAKIMALRFISKKGEGTTANAVKAIMYAVNNGAQVMSNSWGSNGEDPNNPAGNKALRDAIKYAQTRGVLFVAAAGNGNAQGVGFDNDTSATATVPASYPYNIIISVAALDQKGNLASFSNWGKKSVDLGAPGVKIFSTVPGDKYSDTIINFGPLVAYWDGTSMATPQVAGAAALYIATHPNATWQEVKSAILSSASPIPSLADKVVSGGELNVQRLLQE